MNRTQAALACQLPPAVLDPKKDARRLDGRIALVTGGARGAGRAHARLLAARGATVAIADIDADVAAATADDIRQESGVQTLATGCDISTRKNAESCIRKVTGAFGALDILVHNAGMMYSMTGLAETDDDNFEQLLGVNVRGPLYLTRAALPFLRQSRAPRVIFINSQWGQVPDGHSYAYMVSKAAQLGLMKTLAKEFVREGILVNAVTPGAIQTRMVPPEYVAAEEAAIPLGRLVQPEEIACMVAFLASDEAAFISGQCLPVNGGALLVGI